MFREVLLDLEECDEKWQRRCVRRVLELVFPCTDGVWGVVDTDSGDECEDDCELESEEESEKDYEDEEPEELVVEYEDSGNESDDEESEPDE